jgi:hypothetical protein
MRFARLGRDHGRAVNPVVRALLVLAIALPAAIFFHSWANADPSHIHYATQVHHPAYTDCPSRPLSRLMDCNFVAAHTSVGTHYVSLRAWAMPGAVAIAILGVALALVVAGRTTSRVVVR